MKQAEQIERLLFISRFKAEGDEASIRKVCDEEFPRGAFEEAGLAGFTASTGGGYCVFEFGFEGEFDATFERVQRNAAIQRFLDRLAEHVEPAPRITPGRTASQPVAADMFLWRIESGIRVRESAGRSASGGQPRGDARR